MGQVRKSRKVRPTRAYSTKDVPLSTMPGEARRDGYRLEVCDPEFVESYERLLAAEDAWPDVVDARGLAIVSPAGAVLTVGIGVFAALINLAVPRFAELYEAFGMTLPLYTRALIAVSAWLASGWGWFGLAVLAYVCVRVTREVRDSSPAMSATGLALLAVLCSLRCPGS